MKKVCMELENIELSFLDQIILDIPRLAVHQFDRIGIVGKNGAEKSTLLKLLDGQIAPDKGHVNRVTDFACFDQLSTPAEKETDYKMLGKLSVPQIEIDRLSGGEQTRMKLAQLFSTYHEGFISGMFLVETVQTINKSIPKYSWIRILRKSIIFLQGTCECSARTFSDILFAASPITSRFRITASTIKLDCSKPSKLIPSVYISILPIDSIISSTYSL